MRGFVGGGEGGNALLVIGADGGSDAQLVAPVKCGKGAYVAAGTTVTEDVPAGALAIGRARQKNVKGWVARRKRK